jgi:hypothetical protein
MIRCFVTLVLSEKARDSPPCLGFVASVLISAITGPPTNLPHRLSTHYIINDFIFLSLTIVLFGIANIHDFHRRISFNFKRLSKNQACHGRKNCLIMILFLRLLSVGSLLLPYESTP